MKTILEDFLYIEKIKLPLYGTKLTLGLVDSKLKEHGIQGVELNEVKARDTLKIGCFNIEFIKVNHSIPDSVALAIHTPIGTVVHTGDFKVIILLLMMK